MTTKIKVSFLIVLNLILLVGTKSVVLAIKNISAVYCQELGYEFSIQEDQAGNQTGVCKFPDGQSCPAFAFLQGQCGQNYSYCPQKGYILKSESDPQKCNYMVVPCSICVAQDGTEIGEVSVVMKLNLQEGKCGDGMCTMDESYENCSQDCPLVSMIMPTSTPAMTYKISFFGWLIMKIKEAIAIIMGMIKK